MFVNITNIKLEGKTELWDTIDKVNVSAPFTEDILNNPEYYPIADEYRAFILQNIEKRCGAKIEGCDMEFTVVHPKVAQLTQAEGEELAEKELSEPQMARDLRLLKAIFHEEPYEKLPDAFKHLPFTVDMHSNPIGRDAMDRAYRHLLGITMDLLTYCTIDFAELSDEEFQRHMEGLVRPTMLSGICESMFAPYLQWKNLPEDASTFKFVQDNLGDLAAEVLQHPSNHYRVARLMLVILYTRALADPQFEYLDPYWMDDEEQAHNYLYYAASIHVSEQYLADMLMGGIFSNLNTTTESTMPDVWELQELYDTAHRIAMSLNIKSHKLAMQTVTNVTKEMRNVHLTPESIHISAYVTEQDDEAKCRIVEVRYQNTDTIAESYKNEIKDACYIYTTHTQEWNAEKEGWETTVTQPFALSNGDTSTLFSGEYGQCMILSDDRLALVLQRTVVSDEPSSDEFEEYNGIYMWSFPRTFKRLVACAGRNTLSLLKEYGNNIFYLASDDENVELD